MGRAARIADRLDKAPLVAPWFSNGSFAAEGGVEESIYRIEVLDKVGRRKKGWVACGFSVDDINVHWDD
jgi:hypothetical protein